jgi:hypothetical protein
VAGSTGRFDEAFKQEEVIAWNTIRKELEADKKIAYTIVYSPSYPTPVGLKIINSSTRQLKIGYNLRSASGVNAEKEQATNILFRQGKDRFIDWTLAKSTIAPAAGVNRLPDFSGYHPRYPVAGKIAAGQYEDKCNSLTTNGLYWASPKVGTVMLQGMMFTPFDAKASTPLVYFSQDCTTVNAEMFSIDPNNNSITHVFDPRRSASDNLKNPLSLYDVTGATKNTSQGQPQIKSWVGIVEAANDGKLCTKLDRESADFKWNPQEVYSEEFQRLVEAK